MKEKKWIQKLSDAFGRYKYVLLVALVGVILLTWPSGESAQAESPAPGIEEDLFQVSRMEEKLKRALSQVEGAGEVTVVLTLRESPRQVLAQDGEGSEETSTAVSYTHLDVYKRQPHRRRRLSCKQSPENRSAGRPPR